ncbi:MAG: cytochrome c oxidase assembly protein, partial [Sciscionella sp.]
MESSYGMNVGPLSWGSVLNTWTTAPIADLLCALAAAGYLWRAYRTLPRIGQRWPIRRTAAFLGGLAVLLLTLHSFIGVYAHPSFTIHMVLHLLVIMVVPALVIMGQPLRMLSATSDRLGTGTQSTLGSPVMRV